MANSINVLKPSVCFEVQKIIAISASEGNCRTYQVQWAPSWISGIHLIGCENLIEEFVRKEEGNHEDIKVEIVDVDDEVNNDNGIKGHNLPDESGEQYIHSVASDTNKSILHNKDRINSLDLVIQNIQDKSEQYIRRNTIHPNFQTFEKGASNIYRKESSQSENRVLAFQSDIHASEERADASYCGDVDLSPVVVGHITDHDRTESCEAPNVVGNVGTNSCQTPQVVTYIDAESCQTPQIISYLNKVSESEDTVSPDKQFQHKLSTNHNNENDMLDVKVGTFKALNERESALSREGGETRDILGSKSKYKLKKRFDLKIVGHHTSNGDYQCHICYRNYTSKINLQRHELIHSSGKSFCCNFCKKIFTDEVKLQAHVGTHSASDRPHKCTLCEKVFQKSTTLERHIKVHTGERPFECEVCQKTFQRSDHLQRHFQTHLQRPFNVYKRKCIS